MTTSYLNTTTSGTTPASVVNADGRAIVIRKILVGNPVTAGNITIHNTNNALANDTTTIAAKITFPTFSTTNTNGSIPLLDFRTNSTGGVEEDGLFCANGSSIVLDQTMQVTVFWDYAQE